MTTTNPDPSRTGRWIVRLVAAALGALAAVLGSATPALAHDELRSSTPTTGAQLAVAPDTARLVFSATLDPLFVSTAVTTADGRRWEAGQAMVEGSTVVVPLQTSVPAGDYTVAYRVTSQDGHPISGGVTYTVTTSSETATSEPTAAAPSAPATDVPLTRAADAEDRGSPVWPWLVGAIVVILAAAALIIRRIAK